MAGMRWMQGFMARHADISSLKPENMSVARAFASNVVNIKAFMVNYETLLTKQSFQSREHVQQRWDWFESYCENPKLLFKCYQNQAGQATDAERGELLTVSAIINAVGNSILLFSHIPEGNTKIVFLSFMKAWVTDSVIINFNNIYSKGK